MSGTLETGKLLRGNLVQPPFGKGGPETRNNLPKLTLVITDKAEGHWEMTGLVAAAQSSTLGVKLAEHILTTW